MYVKVKDEAVLTYPYTKESLEHDNPSTTFDDRFSLLDWFLQTEASSLHGEELHLVVQEEFPEINAATHTAKLKEIPEKVGSGWGLRWEIIPYTNEQIQLIATADPLG